MALGFGMLVFLSLVIATGGDAEALVSFLVFLALLLFVVYGFRNRHVTGSSYRYFLFDVVVMGLWATLIFTMDLSGEAPIVVWGTGVVLYEGIAITMLAHRGVSGAAAIAARGAHMVWIQIGCFAVFYELLVETILRDAFGVEFEFVGVLLIIAPFILFFRVLKSRFLALSTRLWIGITLAQAADTLLDKYQYQFAYNIDAAPSETLRTDLLSVYATDLIWVAFGFLIGIAATVRVPPVESIAWWRGLIWPRHMVLLRKMGRLIMANASRIAFIGGMLSAIGALLKWMQYAGGKHQGFGSRNLMLLGVYVYAVAMTNLFGRFLYYCCAVSDTTVLKSPLLEFASGDLIYVLSWCVWGLLLYLYGVFIKDYLARFFSIGFVLMPIVMYASNNTLSNESFFAQTALSCCVGLFCLGLLRRVAG
jgi:hypothetical protein